MLRNNIDNFIFYDNCLDYIHRGERGSNLRIGKSRIHCRLVVAVGRNDHRGAELAVNLNRNLDT